MADSDRKMNDRALRCELVDVARAMNSTGLNQGTSGNLSLRIEGGLLVTPSSLAYDQMEPEDLVAIDFCGQPLPRGLPVHPRRPSSEWRLHADVLADRPDAMAVFHCHPIHATALACHDRGIPPFHYMTAIGQCGKGFGSGPQGCRRGGDAGTDVFASSAVGGTSAVVGIPNGRGASPVPRLGVWPSS